MVATNYNVTPTNVSTGTTKTIKPSVPANTIANTSFIFTGVLTGYSTAPSLTYSVDGAAAIAVTGVTATGWSMTIVIATSGTHTIVVSDGAGTTGSASFTTASSTQTLNPVPWNPATVAGGLTLSSGNYLATSTGSATAGSVSEGVIATNSIASGKPVLWEVTPGAISQNWATGVCNTAFALTLPGGLGADANGIGFYPSTGTGSQAPQTAYLNNNQLISGNGVASPSGSVVTIVCDGVSIWFSDAEMRSTAGVNWNGSATADPATNVGGLLLGSMGTVFPVFQVTEGGTTALLNDGTSAFTSFATSYLSAHGNVTKLAGTAAVKTISANTPTGVIQGAAFTFTGSLSGYTSAPTLTYSLNGASSVALPGVTATGWSATITTNVASNTIVVTDGTLTSTVTFAAGTVTTGGNFTVSGGQLFAPSGAYFVPSGINIADFEMSTVITSASGGPMTQLFPGINCVRVACYSYNPPSYYQQFIAWCNGLNIVVLLENHQNFNANGSSAGNGGGANGVFFTNANGLLQPETAWYTALAQTYGSNPWVWFGTNNEPPGPNTGQPLSGLSTWQQSTYNTIRTNGAPNNIILLELFGGGDPYGYFGSSGGLTVSTYATMHNVLWDWHQYGWMFPNAQGQSGANSAQSSVIPQSLIQSTQLSDIVLLQQITGADGIIPVIGGECGDSTTGNPIDTSGQAVVQAVIANVSPQPGSLCGALFWEWNSAPAPGDRLQTGGALTSPYGTAVAAFVAKSNSYGGPKSAITGIAFTPATSISANSPIGTTAGTLTLQSSGGAISSATYAITSQSTAGAFSVSGNTVSFASASVASGSYTLSIRVTASAASNSPQTYTVTVTVVGVNIAGITLSSTSGAANSAPGTLIGTITATSSGGALINPTFTIANQTGPAVTGNFVNVDFSTNTGQTVSRYIWGVGSGTLGNSNFAAVANSTVQGILGGLAYPAYRFNANLAGAETAFPGGATTATTAQLNTAFGNLIDNMPKMVPADCRIILGVGSYPTTFWSSAANFGAMCTVLGNYLNTRVSAATGKPLNIYGFEFGNEVNSGGAPPAGFYSYWNAAAVALKAVNPNWKTCGPTFSWGCDLNNFASNCGSHVDFLDWHYYNYAGNAQFNSNGGVAAVLASGPAIFQPNISNARASFASGGGPATTQIMMGEWNQNAAWGTVAGSSGGSGPCNIYMVNSVGAVYAATTMLSGLNADNLFNMACVWDAYQDSDYGLVGATDVAGGGNSISPMGYFVSQAANTLYGSRVSASLGSTNPALQILSVVNGPGVGRFAVMLINTTTATNYTGQIALSHWPVNSSGTSTINQIVYSPANPNGVVTSLSVLAGLTASTTVPAQSVMVLYV